MPADPNHVETIFNGALALPLTKRAAFLAAECGDDADLRARVERLLAAHDELDAPPATASFAPDAGTATFGPDAPEPTADYPGRDERADAVIGGKYALVEPIGEGGMGTVWRAKQTEPVKRFVAVKLIKAGMDSKQVLARFEAERQALAVMDHPNIAKVLDGGLHDARPFFVMELVKGVPITEYCDHHKLTPKARLELFVQACHAIQHAHQKGIIHRDIKPSNVLVALYDDRPVVKVIDFGVAKATGGALTERTIDTGFGGVVGTPQYMSPEQATFNNLDIDTRSDVYALGVLLYELLTGSPPFSKKELEQKGLMEILRIVREEEPPRPSTKLSTADALPSLSANRGTEPKKLTGLLRNELDWIVMKALEKDRTRRYETANGFAADVLRYLSGEAVLAHPPSAGYRLRKFVRRNRGQVVAASLVLLALLAGIVGTSWQAVRAERARADEAAQRQLAEANEKEANDARAKAVDAANRERLAKVAEEVKRKEAETNLAFATKGNEILTMVFAGLDPNRNYANVGELLQVLKENLTKAAKELDGAAVGDPLVVARMQNNLGISLVGLGDSDQAGLLFQKARDTFEAKFGRDHPDTLTNMNNVATCLEDAGKLDLALPLYEETFRLTKAKLGPDHPDTITSMSNLAGGYRKAGKLDLALPLFEETLRLRKATQGLDHPETLKGMGNLATTYRHAKKLDLALPLNVEAHRLCKATLGQDHPETVNSMAGLAITYRDAGKLDLALPLFEEALRLRKAKLGLDHPDTLSSMSGVAACLWSLRRLDQSVPRFEELLPLLEKKHGRAHPETQTAVANLGVNYLEAGRAGAAVPLLEEAYRTSQKQVTLRWVGSSLVDAYAKTNKPAEAAKLIGELLAEARQELPNGGPPLAGQLAFYGSVLMRIERHAEAEPLLRECWAIRGKSQPEAWNTFNSQSMLGAALLGQKKYADAEPLLVKGYEGLKAREKSMPQGSTRIPEALDRLIELYTATNKPDEVKKYRDLRAKYPTSAPMPRAAKG
ncbi:MAG: serine/threonine protein kinase [Planctomycetes bacterium]|nr:serine/threonine protein kinase [Planctomycetota bacterium]